MATILIDETLLGCFGDFVGANIHKYDETKIQSQIKCRKNPEISQKSRNCSQKSRNCLTKKSQFEKKTRL